MKVTPAGGEVVKLGPWREHAVYTSLLAMRKHVLVAWERSESGSFLIISERYRTWCWPFTQRFKRRPWPRKWAMRDVARYRMPDDWNPYLEDTDG